MPMNIDDNNDGGASGGLAAFQRLVDAFGSDQSRWPAGRLAAAQTLLNSGSEQGVAARRYLAEARAFDRLLYEAVPLADAGRVANLSDRIAQAAHRTATPANVIRLGNQANRRSLLAAAASPNLRGNGWAASALLAASLLLGVFAGPAVTSLSALHDVADAVGINMFGDQLALSAGEDGNLQDEDVL